MPAETGTSLLKIALDWLREDRDLRKQREIDAGGKARGPQAEVSVFLFFSLFFSPPGRTEARNER